MPLSALPPLSNADVDQLIQRETLVTAKKPVTDCKPRWKIPGRGPLDADSSLTGCFLKEAGGLEEVREDLVRGLPEVLESACSNTVVPSTTGGAACPAVTGSQSDCFWDVGAKTFQCAGGSYHTSCHVHCKCGFCHVTVPIHK